MQLAPVPAYDEFWQVPIEKDPWQVPLEEKIELLRSVTGDDAEEPVGAVRGGDRSSFEHEWKYLATSEGSFIEQVFHFTNCSREATARTGTQVKTRNYERLAGAGYEFLLQADLPGNAERVAAEAVEHSMAKPVERGLKDLVLMPSHLGLTIHEIVAHATELDRIAGYEANYAGTSFVKICRRRQAEIRLEAVQRQRRSHVPDRHGDRRLRRRRREGAEVADREGRHPRRPADQPRDRAPHRREGKPRLHVRQPLAQLSVPADAEHPARAGPRRDRRPSTR